MNKWLWITVSTLFLLLPWHTTPLHAQGGTELPGMIAYIGDDSNVYTYDFVTEASDALTDDGGRARQYQWPMWSRGDELAYFCCDVASGQPFLETYVSVDGVQPGEVINVSDEALYTYASWSPRGCDDSDGCRDLAVLLSLVRENAFGADVIRSGVETGADAQRIGLGSPFYYSWSPDGRQILLQRNTRSIGVYDLESESIANYDTLPGAFPAPQWSPVDDRLLVGTRNETRRSTDLAILAGEAVEILYDDLSGEVAFNWSPNGNHIAFRSLNETGVSPITVLDAITGDVVTTSGFDNAFAFFWSPDSRKIAYITVASPRGSFNVSNVPPTLESLLMQEDGLQWAVLDVETGETHTFGSFIPTSEMVYLLSYFNQFSQSHSIWSPDSTHIVFSEVDATTGERRVAILDITRPDAVPFAIADGVIGIWSYN